MIIVWFHPVELSLLSSPASSFHHLSPLSSFSRVFRASTPGKGWELHFLNSYSVALPRFPFQEAVPKGAGLCTHHPEELPRSAGQEALPAAQASSRGVAEAAPGPAGTSSVQTAAGRETRGGREEEAAGGGGEVSYSPVQGGGH